MHLVVTGGAGFIGSHIVDAFIERGWRVSVIDDLSTGNRDNVHANRLLLSEQINEKLKIANCKMKILNFRP